MTTRLTPLAAALSDAKLRAPAAAHRGLFVTRRIVLADDLSVKRAQQFDAFYTGPRYVYLDPNNPYKVAP